MLAHAAVAVRDGAFERQQPIGDRRRGVDHARAGQRRGIDPGREPGAVDQDEIGLLVERDGLGVGLPERRIGAGRRREAHARRGRRRCAPRSTRARSCRPARRACPTASPAEPPSPPRPPSPAPQPRTASDASTTIDSEQAHPDHGFSCASPVIGTNRTGSHRLAVDARSPSARSPPAPGTDRRPPARPARRRPRAGRSTAAESRAAPR